MKLQKGILSFATLSMLGFLAVACNDGGGGTVDRYAQGLEEGRSQGFQLMIFIFLAAKSAAHFFERRPSYLKRQYS